VNLSQDETDTLLSALYDHENIVRGWDAPNEAATRQAEIIALRDRLYALQNGTVDPSPPKEPLAFADGSHGAPSDRSVPAKDALRAALVQLRAAVDDAEVADHIPGTLLDIVDYILESTGA
jgi:hypothetical protein